ncbi:MAG: single-strand DNA-binding protein [Candidatus Berkelbacteria bacterium Licking1014_7]|uniref:Single-stranded DNA-binding protein n=1 Tax=Candidatus Berkelbacteria bacterium Licking1014_7 TaxID=2017147 RepID=A0A554LJT4_9BACT|nr:MAG: single-strand DNA-binding protein [Candidatus Berkelbacteria bacterium Licking1014_7]
MFSVNKAIILGNLTRDPELRYTGNGQAVVNFGVATNRRYKNVSTGETVDDTQFHDVVAWGKLAELINQMLKKGNKIYLEGRLQTRQWEAPDGSKRYRTEIIMENFVVLTPKSENVSTSDLSTSAPSEPTPTETNQTIDKTATDLEKNKPESKTATAKVDNSNNEEDINLDDIPF